ncbi:HAMP domain-containing protein [Dictyobacter arantiisoli]|uniref:HAMP domain-containing protein n=1 Tax=Dictyobacter arantiisoli TaxID=2014874 RepID=A0A5A5TA59_9CHLR|nr:hypothetical protein [Dictyobacter arantiisoli]GCF08381.1 hypothetical protein KDI_19450 [Dictyobacter arantiisoli]
MVKKSAGADFTTVSTIVGERRGFWGWWLNLTAPPLNGRTMASPPLREQMRKAELISYLLFILSFFMIFDLVLAIVLGHLQSIIFVFAFIVFLSFLAYLNHAGHMQATAVALVAAIIMAIMFVIALTPSTQAAADLFPTYDFFVYPIVLGSLFIPRKLIVPFTLICIAFIFYNLLFQAHSPDIEHVKRTSGVVIWLIRPAAVLIVIALANWLGRRSVDQSLLRADRAEELMAAQNLVALQTQEIAEQKAQLEAEVAQILLVHREVAAGNYTIRAPVRTNTEIWQIGRSLNNLLARYEQFAYERQEWLVTQEDAEQIAAYLEALRHGTKAALPATRSLAGKRLLAALSASPPPISAPAPVAEASAVPNASIPTSFLSTPPDTSSEQRPFPASNPANQLGMFYGNRKKTNQE